MLNKKLKFTLYQFIINHYVSKTDWILGVYWILIFIIMLTNSTYLNDLNVQTNPSILNIFFMFYFPIWLICQISGWFTSSSFNKIDLSKSNKLILSRILLKKHNLSSLNLELQKISKAVENKSSLYQELNENDFPYLNKLFRRLNCLQATHNNIENISSNDLNKLNISNPMLLTFEQVDNELNNLIGQNILNQNIKCVKTMEK